MRPTAPGTFPVVSFDLDVPEGNAVRGAFQRSGSQARFQSGTVELTSVAPPAGNLDVTLETGERLSGTFVAKACTTVPLAF